MLACKASLAIRVDALGEGVGSEMGIDHRAKLEARLRNMEEGQVGIWSDTSLTRINELSTKPVFCMWFVPMISKSSGLIEAKPSLRTTTKMRNNYITLLLM